MSLVGAGADVATHSAGWMSRQLVGFLLLKLHRGPGPSKRGYAMLQLRYGKRLNRVAVIFLFLIGAFDYLGVLVKNNVF